MKTVMLLTVSNVFMTFAWYGHLRYKDTSLWKVIVISWLIAFAEYCFQVPANRIGHYQFSAAQLKIIQEVITLVVFAIFSLLYLKEEFKWNYLFDGRRGIFYVQRLKTVPRSRFHVPRSSLGPEILHYEKFIVF